jgi:hypothetical protein
VVVRYTTLPAFGCELGSVAHGRDEPPHEMRSHASVDAAGQGAGTSTDATHKRNDITTVRSHGMWFGVSDDTLAPLAVPPVQFYDVWSRSRAISPEHGLALAVMELAINDLITHRFAHRRRHQRAYWEAYQWMVADDHEWPFSFINLCASLRLEAEPIRRQLLDGTNPGDMSRSIAPCGPQAVVRKAA